MQTVSNQKLATPERSETNFCHNLSPATLKFIEKARKQIAYPKDALVFTEGQTPSGCFILTEGRVKLTMSSREGNRFILKVIEAGGVFGLYAAVSGVPHQVSAETLEPSKANFIKREDLLRLMREDGDFRLRVLESLCFQYTNACTEIGYLVRSPAARLAKFLLESPPSSNDDEPAGELRLYLGLTHEEIAEKIGVARETVSRLFAELQKLRIVRVLNPTRSNLVILDKSALCEVASGDLIVRRKRT
jgi:CRP/FNR family transcriptional regulator